MKDNQWYMNSVTGEIAQGKLWPDTVRLGPYPTREAAADAWATIEERNKEWDDDDKKWRSWYSWNDPQSDASDDDDNW